MSQNSELILKGIMGLDEEAALAFIKRYGMISRVTRRDGAMTIGYAHDGLIKVLIGEAHGAQHGAVGRALRAGGNGFAANIVGHKALLQ